MVELAKRDFISSDAALIMVCGSARSGTTMLDLMLGNADDAVSTGEVFALFRPYMPHHLSPECSCGNPDCDFWAGLLDIPASQFHASILRQRPNAKMVVDSSKDLRWVVDSNVWARQQGLPVKNVVIWKNAKDLSYSYWRRGDSISMYRNQFLTYYGRLLDLGLPFVALNYQTLVDDTQSTLRELCLQLGLAYDDSRMEFWRKQHHHFFGSSGTKRQVGKSDSSIKKVTDFPDEFLRLFEDEQEWLESSAEFNLVVEQLRARDVSQHPNLDEEANLSALRPIWYYRHMLKSAWWKIFPSQALIQD